jgi:hypothetical protein
VNVFHCDHCTHLVFFENTQCIQCKQLLAYRPDARRVGSLEPTDTGVWRSPDQVDYRLCANYTTHNVCNWAIPVADSNTLCVSCRLTEQIPDLTVPGHKEAWYRLETAKRRLLYTLTTLQLPPANRIDDPQHGLAFALVADVQGLGGGPVLTGHLNGVITINVAEADDAERERRRLALHEPYRTLLGHFRHEVGHYYWTRLIEGTDRLDGFRALFGDERADYSQALSRHYELGAPPDWQNRFVSAYATTHPWEDWAETWAHYLHVFDTLETAAACGISLRPRRDDEPSLPRMASTDTLPQATFDELIERWFPVTYMLNNLNRGLGLPDGYPFVLSTPAIEKMRFVHDVIARGRRAVQAPAENVQNVQTA